MSSIIKPVSWWDMVSPREEEMPDFLRAYVGKGKQFRTPKRKWEELWRLHRGDVNDILGVRRAQSISNRFKGPKYQRGVLSPIGFWVEPAGGGGTEPDLSDITNTESNTAPTRSRTHVVYDSDGSILFYTGTAINPDPYTQLTTQSGDANDHTNEWWPDQPETNEGLNWDIRFTNENDSGAPTASWKFHRWVGSPQVSTARTVDVWYLLDTVSNDADPVGSPEVGHTRGSYGVNRNNGTAKSPSTGTATQEADIEIRATGSGSAVASHLVSLVVTGT